MRDGVHELKGSDGTYIVVTRDSGHVVAAFYAEETEPGWWRGHAHGRVRRLFLPRVSDPVTVAGRFLTR
jgi:hypothetical protein